jgi:hypothetical protein
VQPSLDIVCVPGSADELTRKQVEQGASVAGDVQRLRLPVGVYLQAPFVERAFGRGLVVGHLWGRFQFGFGRVDPQHARAGCHFEISQSELDKFSDDAEDAAA